MIFNKKTKGDSIMKKSKLIMVIMAMLMVVTCLWGCSNSEDTPDTPDVTEEIEKVSEVDENGFRVIPETYLTVSAGSASGGWYIIGAGLNERFESLIPGLKMTLIPGGGSSNPTVVNENTAQIGFTYIQSATSAKKGVGDYTEAHDDLVAIGSLNITQYLNVNLISKMGINNFSDLVEQQPSVKISGGPRGSGTESMFKNVLQAYGVDYETIDSWGGQVQFISTAEGMDAIRNGQIDGIVNSSVMGLPSLIEICSARDLTFLSIDEEHAEKLSDDFGYGYANIPSGTYKGQNEDIPTITDTVILVTNKNVSNDVVYNITKVLCENKDKWEAIHSSLEDFDPNVASEAGIELHPGAIEYYKEAGLLK